MLMTEHGQFSNCGSHYLIGYDAFIFSDYPCPKMTTDNYLLYEIKNVIPENKVSA